MRMMMNELHWESVVSSNREGRWLMMTWPTPNFRPSWAICRVVVMARFSASDLGWASAKLCASSRTWRILSKMHPRFQQSCFNAATALSPWRTIGTKFAQPP